MAHNNIEIEIQVQVERVEPLIAFLKAHATFRKETHQIDEYFSSKDEDKDFLKTRPVKEWLRVREANGTASMNYKDWQYDAQGKSQYCTEYETKIEDASQVRNIFKALYFKSIAVVDKHRTIYSFKDYEISIDSVRDLGEFVEIEYCGFENVTDPKRATDDMVAFLKEIGCGKITRNYLGYPFMILFPDEATYEEV